VSNNTIQNTVSQGKEKGKEEGRKGACEREGGVKEGEKIGKIYWSSNRR
jgi:hypothetical protein